MRGGRLSRKHLARASERNAAMRKGWLSVGLVAVVSTGFVVACGDDDSSVASNQDAGTTGLPDASVQNPADSGGTDSAKPDADAATPTSAPIVPLMTVRIPNAINPYGLLYASDGFLYSSGGTVDNGTRKLGVWRFKDGALDTTFGTGGVITLDVPGGDSEASWDIVEVSAGNFVVHVVTGGKVYLVKLTKDAGGTFSFGTPVFVRFGWDEDEGWPGTMPNAPATPPTYISWGIGLDKSNAASPKIVVFAYGAPDKAADPTTQRSDNDRWITRVSADTFAFDTSFNGGKPYTVDADGKNINDNARRGTVLSDGSIISAGYTNFGQGLGNHVVLIRLLPNGTPDTTFGFGTTAPGIPGQTKFNPFLSVSGGAEAYGVARQSSGYYVTTGYGTSNFDVTSKNADLVSFRVKPDGIDTTWGKLGSFAIQSEPDKSAGLGVTPNNDRGRDVVVLSDDRVVQVGHYDDYASVFVLDKNGKLDPSSGTGGIIEYAYPGGFFKVALSPDGKTLAATAESKNQTGDAGAPLGSVLATLEIGQ